MQTVQFDAIQRMVQFEFSIFCMTQRFMQLYHIEIQKNEYTNSNLCIDQIAQVSAAHV